MAQDPLSTNRQRGTGNLLSNFKFECTQECIEKMYLTVGFKHTMRRMDKIWPHQHMDHQPCQKQARVPEGGQEGTGLGRQGKSHREGMAKKEGDSSLVQVDEVEAAEEGLGGASQHKGGEEDNGYGGGKDTLCVRAWV